jgi:hypothetical protein
MAIVLSENAEVKEKRAQETQADRSAKPALLSSFKYYIHDSVGTLRFQLIGDLRYADVTELNGSWETAQITLALRRLVLDLRQLESADEHGRRWLLKMKESGATFSPADYFEAPWRPGSTRTPTNCAAPGLLGRIRAVVRPKP